MRLMVIILVVLMVCGLPAAVLAQESGTGTIDGQVINGTEGGGIDGRTTRGGHTDSHRDDAGT